MQERDDRPIDGLDTLFADHTPPEDQEDAIVERLRAEGRLSPPSPRVAPGRAISHWPRVAAAVVLLGVGWAGGRLGTPSQPSDVGGSSEPISAYMLLLWEGDGFAPTGSLQQVAAEYAGWAAGVRASGTALSGHELGPDRRLAGEAGSGHAPAGRVGGYFVVEDVTPDRIEELAATHPHVGYGGWIEVAPVVLR